MSYKLIVHYQNRNDSYGTISVPSGEILINGVAITPDTEITRSDASLVITYNLPSSTGYTFYQWKYSVNGGYSSNTSSNASITITPAQDAYVIIWCRVQGIQYNISYSYNYPDGSSGSYSSTFTYGTNFSLRGSISQSGYTFLGWQIDNVTYAPSSTFAGQPNDITAVGQWQQGRGAQYSIFYFYNNANGGVSNTSSIYEGSNVALASAPSYSGYQFLGWRIDGTLYSAGSTFSMPSHDVRADGVWRGQEIIIYFNTNGGVPNLAPLTIRNGEAFELPSTIPVKTSGGTFTGWYLNSSYYCAGETATITSTSYSINATAQYSSYSSVTVTYRLQNTNYGSLSGATTATLSVPGTYGNNFPTVTATGNYVFAGWYAGSNLTYKPITASTEIAYYSSHSVYANFYLPQTFVVSPNGGTWKDGTTDSTKTVTFKYGDTLSFPGVTREGYGDPIGWFTSSSIYGGVEYVEGDLCAYTGTSTSSIYIYARWPQEVTFNGNNGTPATQKSYFAYGNTYSPLPTATRENYALAGWFTSSSGGTQVTTSSYVTTSTTRTLYAQWNIAAQTVTFNPNGGSSPTTTSTYAYPGVYSDLPVLVEAGRTFQGWYTSSSGGTQVQNGDPVTNEVSRTLYAHWEILQQVTFNANGGYFGSQSQTTVIQYYSKTSGSTYSNFPTPTNDGYTLRGWYTSSSGGTLVSEGDAVTSPNSRTLYAQWDVAVQTVTFDSNGGSTPTTTSTYAYPGTYSNFPVLVEVGQDFLGWYTTSSGGSRVQDGDAVTNASTRTLYAHWQAQQLVTFEANGGYFETQSQTSVSQYYSRLSGSTYTNFPTPTYAVHTFIGWFTYDSGGTQVFEGDSVTNSTSRTLYAQWQIDVTEVTVTFDANGGAFSDQTTSKEIAGVQVGDTLYPPSPTRDGYYLFDGFSNGTITISPNYTLYVDSTVFSSLVASPTFLASWFSTSPVTVSFNANGGSFEGTSDTILEFEVTIGDSIEVPLISRSHYKFIQYNSSTRYYTANPLTIQIANRSDYEFISTYSQWMAQWEYAYEYTFVYYYFDTPPETSTVETTTTVNQYISGDVFNLSGVPNPNFCPGFIFQSWSPSLPADGSAVNSDVTYTAQYNRTDVILTFYDWNYQTLLQTTVAYNTNVAAPSIVQQVGHRPGYTFSGWNKPFTVVGDVYYVAATSTMDVFAVYTAGQFVITFMDWDGQVISTKTIDYGTSLHDFPAAPYREGYTFVGWDNLCVDVTTNLIVNAIYVKNGSYIDESSDESSGEESQAGATPEDYIFVEPPASFWDINKNITGIGRGEPMPNRKAAGTDKIISWEDPIYLREWSSEIQYWFTKSYNGRGMSPDPQNPAQNFSRAIRLSELLRDLTIGNSYITATYSPGQDVHDYSVSQNIFLSCRSWQYPDSGAQFIWYDPGLSIIFKLSGFAPLSSPWEIPQAEISQGSLVLVASLLAAGYISTTVGATDPSSSGLKLSKDVSVDVCSFTSPQAQAIISNCFNATGQNLVTQDYVPLRRQIVYSLYYALQTLANNIVFPWGYWVEIVDAPATEYSWEAEASRWLANDPKASYYYSQITDPSDPAWTTPPDYGQDAPNPTPGVEFILVPQIDAEHEDNEDSPDSQISINTQQIQADISSGDIQELTLAKVNMSGQRKVSWGNDSGRRTQPQITGWQWYSGSWHYSSDAGEKDYYLITTIRGLNQKSKGYYCETSKFRFCIADSSVIRHHTKDGHPSGSVYLRPLKFFFAINVNIPVDVNNEPQWYRKRSGNTYAECIPYYDNPAVNEQIVPGHVDKTILLPWDAEYVGRKLSHNCDVSIWEVSNVKQMIDTVLQMLGILDKWNAMFRNIPHSWEDCPMPTLLYPEEENMTRPITNPDAFSFCNGSAESSFMGSATITIKQISAAFLWIPKFSIGVEPVVPADVQPPST